MGNKTTKQVHELHFAILNIRLKKLTSINPNVCHVPRWKLCDRTYVWVLNNKRLFNIMDKDSFNKALAFASLHPKASYLRELCPSTRTAGELFVVYNKNGDSLAVDLFDDAQYEKAIHFINSGG